MNKKDQLKHELDTLCLSALEHEGTIYLSKESLALLPCIRQKIERCYRIGITREDVQGILKIYS